MARTRRLLTVQPGTRRPHQSNAAITTLEPANAAELVIGFEHPSA